MKKNQTMKKKLAFLALALGLNACQSDSPTEFSNEALAEKLSSLEGQNTTLENVLSDYKGKTIVIDIWASWCPDCIKGMPKVVALQEQFPDVVYLFLSYDKTMESWKSGIEKYDVKGEHYLITSDWKGGGFKDAVSIDWIPRYMVVDKTGKIALFRAIEADDKKLIETLHKQ